MALRLAHALRTGVDAVKPYAHERLSAYSEVGKFSVFAARMRYNMLLKMPTDPTIADYFFEKWLHAWFNDAPSYNFWWLISFAMGASFGILTRHVYFNPDVYLRQQESRKPLPDRHRQYSYSLPYYNCRIRNWATSYKWTMIDNEYDWSDFHPIGYRPNRRQSHRRPFGWTFTAPRYSIQDPLYTSVSHANMNRIYEEAGYSKPPKFALGNGEDSL